MLKKRKKEGTVHRMWITLYTGSPWKLKKKKELKKIKNPEKSTLECCNKRIQEQGKTQAQFRENNQKHK